MNTEQLAVLGVRLIALWLVVDGTRALLANLVTGAAEFDPSYLLYFLRLVVFEPLIAVIAGGLLFACSRGLGRRLTPGPKSGADPDANRA